MSSRSKLKRKAVDDVLGTTEFGTDETDGTYTSALSFFTSNNGSVGMIAVCPKCENERAFFKQIQIRSADEPMTRCQLIRDYFIRISISNVVVSSSLPVCASAPP